MRWCSEAGGSPASRNKGNLLEILDPHHSAAAFIEAVVRQLAYPRGADDLGADPASRLQVAEQVTALLCLGQDCAPEPKHLAGRLAEDATLLSVFFQNIDLLYEHAYPGADAVSRAIMSAVELLQKR